MVKVEDDSEIFNTQGKVGKEEDDSEILNIQGKTINPIWPCPQIFNFGFFIPKCT